MVMRSSRAVQSIIQCVVILRRRGNLPTALGGWRGKQPEMTIPPARLSLLQAVSKPSQANARQVSLKKGRNNTPAAFIQTPTTSIDELTTVYHVRRLKATRPGHVTFSIIFVALIH